MRDPEPLPAGSFDFSEEYVASLLAEFDVTRPEDPVGAKEYCEAFGRWIDEGDGSNGDVDRMRSDLWFMQGVLCYIRGDLENAIDHLQHSIAQSERIGYISRQVLGLRSIAIVFEGVGMQSESTTSISEALDLAHEFGDDRVLALVTMALSALYQAQGAWALLLEASMRTCELAERVGDPHLLSRAYSGVGVSMGHELRIDEGLEWNDRARAAIAGVARPREELYLDLNRWFLFRQADRVVEASAMAEKLVEEIDRLPSADAARMAVNIAATRLRIGDLDGAHHMLQRSQDVVGSERLTGHLVAYHETSARLHEARNDHQQALESLRHQLMAERELRGRNAQVRLVTVERRFERQLAAHQDEIHQLRNVELVAKNDELAALNHQKDEILNVVAHDLRNPLAAAQMLSESLMADPSQHMSADEQDQLVAMRAATSEMGATIDILLHVQDGDSPRTLATVDDVVTRSLAWARGPASERQIDIKEEISPVALEVDGALLRRSLDDVLWVGIRSTAPGGSVSVSVQAEPTGVSITVLSRAIVQRPDDRSLYIARRLVERMHGSITTVEVDGNAISTVIDLREPGSRKERSVSH